MGGARSGTYFRFRRRKVTIEESLTLVIGEISNRLQPGSDGTVMVTSSSGHRCSIRFWVADDREERVVTLCYRVGNGGDVRLPIRLAATSTHFGGKKSLFKCPLVLSGAACYRRAAKLHLPPGARLFGCRRCHELTYQSSQEAHRKERLLARLGIEADLGSWL
jgi:hypothetical protein